MKQKENIFEELGRMRSLIHTRPGVVIKEIVTGPGITSFGSYTNPVTVKDDLWASTYKCVPAQLNVTKYTLKDGSTAYKSNGVVYYNNGRKKLADGTMANYSCDTEFKSDGGGTVDGGTLNTVNISGRNQYLKMVSDRSKSLQTSLGVTPTGKITDTELDLILKKLQGEEVSGEVTQQTQSIPMDANGKPDLDKILASL